jgi:flagellar basal body P-ring protein FlgI
VQEASRRQAADKQGVLAGMKPPQKMRYDLRGSRLLLSVVLLLAGCTPHILGIQGGRDLDETLSETTDDGVDLIGDYASPWGMNFLKVEGVALVNNLSGTGSSPPDSPLRVRLIAEMDSHNVRSSSSVLASNNTSLAIVYGFVRPGAQKNDPFDLRVTTPSRSETSSLEGGWLMPVRLQRMEVLGGALRSGEVSAQGSGPVMIDSIFEGDDDPTAKVRARVLGGGKVLKPRSLGLVVRGEGHSIKLTAQIATAINYRFNTYDRGGAKRGVATAKDDRIIQLDVPPQYRHYVTRYIGVVRNLALSETPAARLDRLEALQARLLDPETAAVTALQLEGVGEEAVGTLEKGLDAADPRVRFFAAEALAYLNEPSAIDPLAEFAAEEPAFRWHAITALAAMDELDAADALAELFHTSSAETRYGAFCALRSRSAHDPLVKGELLNQKFYYHVLSTIGDPMVHVSSTRRQEIVLFGHDQTISPPGVLFAGSHIMLQGQDSEHVKVVRVFAGDQPNKERTCSTRLDEVIRTVVDLGGGYPEVLAMLQQAQSKGHLQSRLVIDALPKSGRRYYADQDEGQASNEPEAEEDQWVGPLPELFRSGNETGTGSQKDQDEDQSTLEEEAASGRGFFGRIIGWRSD